MKKIFFWAVGISLFLGILGKSLPSQAVVQGIHTSIPTATTAPTLTSTPTLTPTLTPTIIPTYTPTPTLIPATPTPIPTATTQSNGLSNDNYYTNVDGNQVHSPANSTDGSVPSGATARCRDGEYSFSQHRRGTCSGHGGVAQWL